MKRAVVESPVDSKRPAADAADEAKVDDESVEEELEFEDDFEDEYEEEEIHDALEEDVEVNLATTASEKAKATAAPSVFRPGIDKVEEGQVLEAEPGTYRMLHRLGVQWPCLSFDILADALGPHRTKFPMTSYVVAGTQADNRDKNKLVVMKWANLHKTSRDGLNEEEQEEDDYVDRKAKLRQKGDDSDDDSDNEEDPELEFRMLKHVGGVNRVRAMPQMSALVASWSDTGSVYVYNIHEQLESLEGRGGVVQNDKPIHTFGKHKTEGYGLAWNPHQVGQLVTSDCAGGVFLWTPATGGSWTQSKVGGTGLSSGEDVAFKRVGDSCANIFAVGGSTTDGTGRVSLFDVRQPTAPTSSFVAHENCDTNVVSWNPVVGQLLLTGGDDGCFKVWDVRSTSRGALANFHWHKEPITSVDWHPTDEAVLAVSSGDDMVSIWDMSVEADNDEEEQTDYPPQLLFLHMGQRSVKEIQFHKQMPGVVVTTAYDGFNIFKTFNID